MEEHSEEAIVRARLINALVECLKHSPEEYDGMTSHEIMDGLGWHQLQIVYEYLRI